MIVRATIDLDALLEEPNSFLRHGLVAVRRGEELIANVQALLWLPFDAGYIGPGPSHLALATLHTLIEPPSEEAEAHLASLQGDAWHKAMKDPRRQSAMIGDARVSLLTRQLQQPFMEQHISTMSPGGGFIPIETISSFIKTHQGAACG